MPTRPARRTFGFSIGRAATALLLEPSIGGARRQLADNPSPEPPRSRDRLDPMGLFDVRSAQQRLAATSGGYEIVHRSPGLEIGVYVLVAPEPDRQSPHEDDEVYVVLEGRGTLVVEDEPIPVEEGKAVFVPAGAEHRFTGYEGLSVLVIFRRPD
jgi:mannose-6-phosphate isomerase-like protein (cupin superfamily)